MENCCRPSRPYRKNLWSGIVYGLIPHTFCIAFFVLSLIGAAGGATLAKRFLLLPHFFLFLTLISLLFATLAAFFYLKRSSCYNPKGLRKKYKYICALYATTIATNILVAYVIMPIFANGSAKPIENVQSQLSIADIEVQIPCPGHAPLIISELEKVSGVKRISFRTPRTFEVAYNPQETSLKDIKTSEIFQTFKLDSN